MTRSPLFDVVGLGCCCLDLLGIIPGMPEVGDEIELLDLSQQGGGEVATALVALAKLGSSVAFVGKIGDDPAGSYIAEELRRYGVDTGHLLVESNAQCLTSIVLIDQQSGERTILAGSSTVSDMLPEEVPAELIENAKCVHLDGTHLQSALSVADRARWTEVPVVLDADVLPFDAEIQHLIERTDVLIASERFAERFTKTNDLRRSLEPLCGQGPSTVVVTLGERGSVALVNGQQFSCDAFDVHVIDTTGAGDVFHGAFIHGMLSGWELEKIMEFASAVAAISCTQIGGRAGIPSYQQTFDFCLLWRICG